MSSFNQISVSQLARLIGTPDAPVIIDVRIQADIDLDPTLIPSAFFCPPSHLESLFPRLSAKRRVVFVCQKGLKLSQGAAALLRSAGFQAESLAGGTLAWQAAGEVALPLSALSANNLSRLAQGLGTRWVTKQRPKVDRIACPWLIRRFIDPHAVILFVAASEVMAVADKFSATPFDVDDADLAHREYQCSFDSMLAHFNLTTAPLQQLASIIRSADTNRLELAPESAGLLAISLGLSRLYRHDEAQLEAGMVIYDALYHWARDAVHESHLHMINTEV
jgi:rhodanese-related sulfurtransferase